MSRDNSQYILIFIYIIWLYNQILKKFIKNIIIENYFLFIFLNMPQLIPFYFINQFSFSFLTVIALIYIFSKYILPLFTFTQVIRLYITKLTK